MGCIHNRWDECVLDIPEDEFTECNDKCPYFAEYDHYADWIRDEDAKLHFQERLAEE